MCCNLRKMSNQIYFVFAILSILSIIDFVTCLTNIPLCRVIQQHRLTNSQWEEKIVDCWLEHKDQLRFVEITALNL